MAALKFLLVACLLYVCSSVGSASLAKVSSLTTEVVQQAISAHVHRDVFGHGRQLARLKREVITKKMEDPKGCIAACRKNESSQVIKAISTNLIRLVALGLENIKGDEMDTPEAEAEFKKRIEASTIKNMGPMFEDLCKVHKNSGLCYKRCPESQSQAIFVIDNGGDQTVWCEPSRNWNNFSEFWDAMTCINETKLEKPCDKKCGEEQAVGNATKLSIDDEEVSSEDEKESTGVVNIKYETDLRKNNAAAGAACKSSACAIDCYKPVMSKKCGAKTYDLFNRMTRVEPHTSLGILKLLKAIDSPEECKVFQ